MRRVLVVDDNVAMAENLAEIVTDTEVGEAAVANSGERALVLLHQDRFDVMITDMRMPGMNGTELVRRARRLDPELPVVVITAFTGDDELGQAMLEGLLTVLAKPVPTKSLIGLLSRARRVRPILIVDDDVALANQVSEGLRDRGLATVTARSLAQLEHIGGIPAVALVDLRLPGGHEGEALERVKALFPEVQVVVMTAYRSEIASPAGVPVVEKPFATAQLLDLIESLSNRERAS